MRLLKLGVLLVVAASVTGCAGLEIAGGGVTLSDSGGSGATIIISGSDRDIIARYYEHRKVKPMPPGLAKRNQLPHGLAKRDTLPRGLHERRLPADLVRRLSPAPAGYVRVIVGTDVVLMNSKTRVVMDIYRDVVR